MEQDPATVEWCNSPEARYIFLLPQEHRANKSMQLAFRASNTCCAFTGASFTEGSGYPWRLCSEISVQRFLRYRDLGSAP